MQKLLVTFILILTAVVNAQSRIETNYYPINTGDIWQYKITYSPEVGSDTIFYLTKKVLRDTVQTNGQKYFIVEQPPFTFQRFTKTRIDFIRVDSLSGSVFQYNKDTGSEDQIDSLFAGNSTSFKVRLEFSPNGLANISSTLSEQTVFSEVRKLKTNSGLTMSGAGFYWTLAYGLGLFYQENWTSIVTAFGNKYELIYAKINGKEFGTYVSVSQNKQIIDELFLSQNYPNPFNPETTIEYHIPNRNLNTHSDAQVLLKIYDLLGRELRTLVNEVQRSGYYKVKFNGSGLASGVYIYKIVTGDQSISKKFLFIK